MNSRQTKSKISEFSLIKKYFAPLAGEGSFNLEDDAAQITPSEGMSFVITQDAIAEGIHFFSDDPPELIAKKALRVNISDLTAKGALPKYISLALGLGSTWDEAWVAGFAQGLEEELEYYGVELTGGDTFRTGGGFIISITAIGEVPKGNYISRLGAKDGDVIYVTGTIGDAALGLLARQGRLNNLSKENSNFLIDQYLLPNPLDGLQKLFWEFATASMDISDGLVGDMEKLCKASGVGAELQIESIPLSTVAQSAILLEPKLLETALTGGDDYQTLFTVVEERQPEFHNLIKNFEGKITRIGTIKSGQSVKVFDTSGQVVEFKKTAYDHSGENF